MKPKLKVLGMTLMSTPGLLCLLFNDMDPYYYYFVFYLYDLFMKSETGKYGRERKRGEDMQQGIKPGSLW